MAEAPFAEIFMEALATILATREHNGYLPSLVAAEAEKRITVSIPESSWQVFEDLAEMLKIPPQVILVAVANAAASSFLSKYKKES